MNKHTLYCENKLVEINGYLFLAEDSNKFFKSIIDLDGQREFYVVNCKDLSVYEEQYLLFKKSNIDYRLIVVPDRLIYLIHLFDKEQINQNYFNNRRAIEIAKKFNFASYSPDKFNLIQYEIIETADSHLTSNFILKYFLSHLNLKGKKLFDLIDDSVEFPKNYGGDLFDMLSDVEKFHYLRSHDKVKNFRHPIFAPNAVHNLQSCTIDFSQVCVTFQSSGEKILEPMKVLFKNAIFYRNHGDISELPKLVPKLKKIIHIVTEKFI